MLIKINALEVIDFDKISSVIDSRTGILFIDSDRDEVYRRCEIPLEQFLTRYSQAKKNNQYFLDLTNNHEEIVTKEVIYGES